VQVNRWPHPREWTPVFRERKEGFVPGFIGLPELLLLGLVVLLVFGPKRLPEMGRSIGHGLREFKDSVTGSDTHQPELVPEPTPIERDRAA
jgi:sec-independent protein translocase protein TatA